jgi:hypothetical protein
LAFEVIAIVAFDIYGYLYDFVGRGRQFCELWIVGFACISLVHRYFVINAARAENVHINITGSGQGTRYSCGVIETTMIKLQQ